MKKEMIDRDHLTQSQVARLYGVDRRTLRRWEAEAREGRGFFPRHADGSYCLPAVHWWMIANNIRVDASQQIAARSQRR